MYLFSTISLTGDGCRYCQPQEYIDKLSEWLEEERQENKQLLEQINGDNND